MNQVSKLSLALLAAAMLVGAGCQKRDDNLPNGAPGAGPGSTTTTPSTTPTPGDSTSSSMPPASAASQ